jgi:hypothetical protein
MKTIRLLLLTLSFFAFPACKCPPPNPDGSSGGKCVYVGPSITMSLALRGVTVGATLWGDPAYPVVNIPVNKHDPEVVLPVK